jgi:hypothetical protein
LPVDTLAFAEAQLRGGASSPVEVIADTQNGAPHFLGESVATAVTEVKAGRMSPLPEAAPRVEGTLRHAFVEGRHGDLGVPKRPAEDSCCCR